MSSDLQSWLMRVHEAKTRAEVFRLLDEFRPLNWTDDQRALMSRTYIRALEHLSGDEPAGAPAPTGADSAAGPVWYEKM